MKTLLVLAAGVLQLPAITAAKRMGLRVVVADGDPSAPGLVLADRSHVIDITSPEACLAIARAERVDGVIHICSEVAMASLGLVNREMRLAGPAPDMVVRATNKESMRRAFEAGGAPSPQSIGVKTETDALTAAEKINGPLIIKPSRNSGSRGVSYLGPNRSDAAILAAFRRAMAESRDPSVLVEQYVAGPEYSVEALVWDGRIEILAVTDKQTTGEPHFVETGHCQPTSLGGRALEDVRNAAKRGIQALGLNWCAVHAEVRLSTEGPFLMEIGARLGGDFITTELVPRSTGIDMVEAAISLSLGEVPDLRPRHAPQGAAIRYIVPKPGIVKSIEGVEAARAIPGVTEVSIYVETGSRVREMDSSLARVGHIIAEGRDSVTAIANAETARDLIKIQTKV